MLFGAYSNANVNKSTPNSTIKAVITTRALKLSSLKLRTTLPIAGLCISCNLTCLFLRASAAWCRAIFSPRHEQLPSDVLRLCGHRRGTSSEDWRSPKRKDRPLWRSFGTCSSTRLKSRVPALASRQQPWCPSRSRDGDPKNGLTPTGGGLYLFLEEIAGLRSNDKRGSGRLQDAKNGNWKISN